MTQSKLSAENTSELIRLYGEGSTQADLAKRFGLTQGYVSKVLRGNGVPTRTCHSMEARADRPRSTWKLTAEQKTSAVEMFVAGGKTTTDIGQHFGVSSAAILKLLQSRSIPTPRPAKMTDEQRNDAVARYLAGENTYELASAYSVTSESISALLRRRGITMRTSAEARAPVIRHDAFDILTPEPAYWLGFIFADGSAKMRKSGQAQLEVALSECDRRHLEKLRLFLGSDCAISRRIPKPVNGYSPRPICRLSVRSTRLVTRIHELGRYHDDISHDLASSRHFWRGVVDGDGSIGAYGQSDRSAGKASFHLAGRQCVIRLFNRFLIDHGVIDTEITIRNLPKGSATYQMKTTCRNAVRIIDLLYRDAPAVLDRKAAKAAQITAMYAHMLGS